MTLSNIRRMSKLCAPVLAGVALLAAGASAAQPAGGDVRQACQADIQKYCADVQRGGGRIGKCMKDHGSELSDTCKAAIANRRAEHRTITRASPAAQIRKG